MTLRFVVVLLFCISTVANINAQGAKENLQFMVQPEARHATESSIELVWKTNIATNGQIVIYGNSNKYRKLIDVNETTESHEVTISDLEPSVTYYYRVIAKDGTTGVVSVLKNTRTLGELSNQDSRNGIERTSIERKYIPTTTPSSNSVPTVVTEDK
jgi:Purple acid Phosphatase, N-terminal domain